MTREQLIAYAEKHHLSDALDGEVHDMKSNEATDINNYGTTAQIDYLLSQGYDLDSIESTLKSNVDVDEDEEEEESQEPYDRVGPEPEPESD